MPRSASKEKHKKKVIERWENEGGKVLDRPVNTSGEPGLDGPVTLKQPFALDRQRKAKTYREKQAGP